MQSVTPSVFSFLRASSSADVTGVLDLGSGRSTAIWRNANDRMRYERPDGHTFSLYLEGGTGTKRIDGTSASGWPGALCIMPEGASSEWEITDTFEFVHLYVSDSELRRFYSETFDRDARLMTMPEATFYHAPHMASALKSVAKAARSMDALTADEKTIEVFLSFFEDAYTTGKQLPALKGGLTPVLRRRIVDYIEAHIDGLMTLKELASICGLSEFHFQRMFSASCGTSPHNWIVYRRVSRAKALLATPDPIAEIASACGFSSQSHLTKTFKSVTGTTPAAYRQYLRGQI